ncbi:uncharacterized protein KY384_000968 [Bacidia gigantensis]|uniref:uncharacterized protein n=1 Tax=Bacidia gigantensis TaxID=2732470 RepID=UPI001D057690|nr:uncharacterized protein KY384_000968 [Bacidia gigantensis]KAG8534124.1 hypothetical protein KY384_000968 [Bacidia gigantensis]
MDMSSLGRLKEEVGWHGISGLFSTEATLWMLGYYLFSLVLQTILPGQEVQGVELASGGRLDYKFNAFPSALIVLGAAGIGTMLQGADFALWTFIWDNYVRLITANLGVAFAVATFVYVRSYQVQKGNQDKRELSLGGHTGNIIYDWFMGRELNPRVNLPLFGSIDVKIFCELRPGLLGWLLLDLAFIAHQYKAYGKITDSIVFITLFQGLYVIDALYYETSILSTIDVITDGFGFMLAFGDVVWLPFTYSLQTRYLAVYPLDMGIPGTAGCIAVVGFGYWIFRSANNEKARFRENPKDPRIAHLKYIQTKTGSKLLTSGWWGTARHINYLGDWIMGWSYCLPTGIAGYYIERSQLAAATNFDPDVVQGKAKGWGMIFTYFYILYFAILLIHRERRDDEKCARKYGKDWEEYKKQRIAQEIEVVEDE